MLSLVLNEKNQIFIKLVLIPSRCEELAEPIAATGAKYNAASVESRRQLF